MNRRITGFLVFLFAACIGSITFSQIVLTVAAESGKVEKTFTLKELRALKQVDVHTGNEFIDGMRDFRGPLAREVLKLSGGADATTVRLTAANDYQVEFPAAELRKYNVILALSMDGKPLSKRGKGPIWMIYPMSDHAELRDPVYNSRLIWQLVKMEYK